MFDKLDIIKMEKKQIIRVLGIGGLVLTAPFAALAAGMHLSGQMNIQNISFNGNFGNNLINLEEVIDIQTENAYSLIDKIDGKDNDIDVNELYDIVDEFAQLDKELESLDIEDGVKDDLKEIFLEVGVEATSLNKELRETIKDTFNTKQKEEIKEQLMLNKKFANISHLDENIVEELRGDNVSLNEEAKKDLNLEFKNNIRNKNKNDTRINSEDVINATIKLIEILENIDKNSSEAFQNGDINLNEARQIVSDYVDNLNEKDKGVFFEKYSIEKRFLNNDNKREGKSDSLVEDVVNIKFIPQRKHSLKEK